MVSLKFYITKEGEGLRKFNLWTVNFTRIWKISALFFAGPQEGNVSVLDIDTGFQQDNGGVCIGTP